MGCARCYTDRQVGWWAGHWSSVPHFPLPRRLRGLESQPLRNRLDDFMLTYIISISYIVNLLPVMTRLYFCNVQNNSQSKHVNCLVKHIKQIPAIRFLLEAKKCTNLLLGRGSVRDHLRGSKDAPSDPLIGSERENPLSPPRRLRHLDSHIFGVRLRALVVSLPAFPHSFFTSLRTVNRKGNRTVVKYVFRNDC